MSTHLIKRQILEIDIPDQREAEHWQEMITKLYKQEIIPLLDQLCTSISPGAERIQIDQLELQVTKVDITQPKAWAAAVKAELREILSNKCYAARQGQVMDARWITDVPGDASSSATTVGTGSGDPLFYFLSTGSFPWWHREPIPSTETIRQKLEEGSTDYFLQLAPLLDHPDSRRRLLFHLSENGRQRLLRTYFPEHLSALNKLSVFFTGILFNNHLSDTQRTFFNYCWQADLMEILQQSPASETSLVRKVLQLQFGRWPEDQIAPESVHRALLQHWSDLDWQDIRKAPIEISKPERETTNRKRPVAKGAASDRNIQQAGLVLFWPYLEYFFQDQDLVRGGRFVNEPAQWRAVHLLEYLAAGTEPESEAGLVLPKLLCGLPPTAFVPTGNPLREDECAAARELADAVIENWGALKKTSMEGLREAFIQRPGLLTEDAQGWKLQIERRSMDVLLDRLTWPIGFIQLPWNPYAIYVSW